MFADLEVGQVKNIGLATIKKFEANPTPLEKARWLLRDLWLFVPDGIYMRLIYDGTLEMSDTPMEKNSNKDFCKNAHGDVFIAGLGIGLILHNLRDKVASKEITSITVLEKRQDIIDLVSPYYKDIKNLNIIQGDIFEYTPSKKYDTIYFDIWPEIGIDNLEEIKLLHNKWKFKKPKTGWMNSWMKERLQDMKRKEIQESFGWY